MTYYIQRRESSKVVETVDEFETRTEARAMVAEYSLADRSARYYVSPRACRDWNDQGENHG